MPLRALVLLSLATVWAGGPVHAADQAMSATVIGPENPLLKDGADALQAGRAEEGIRLTLEGLKIPVAAHLAAAAHANVCAGFVMLHRYDEALVHCNTSITLDPGNWRAYNNRAAVFSARSLYDQAIEDIHTGLKLAPNSSTLQLSLRILHENQKVQRQHRRSGANA